MFPRQAVLGLLEEPELEDCMTLVAHRDVKPVPDVYMAVFVVQVEPVPEFHNGRRNHAHVEQASDGRRVVLDRYETGQRRDGTLASPFPG